MVRRKLTTKCHLGSWRGAPHLTLSVTPVMVGAGLAWAVEGKVHWLAVLAALVGIVFQLGTNIHNDAADFERGGDGYDRIGPPRVTASGLLTATTVKRGAIVCFAIAVLMGVYLVFVGGWPILILGVLCIASGWGYTGGPFPIAYTPFAELFVVAFFWRGRGERRSRNRCAGLSSLSVSHADKSGRDMVCVTSELLTSG